MSVPSQWRRPGAWSTCSASGASGSYGVSHGAPSATAVSTISMPRAASDRMLRRSRRHSAAPALRRATTGLPETDSRVDKPVREVDGEVDEHVDDGHEEYEALDRPGVLGHERRHRVVTDPGPGQH